MPRGRSVPPLFSHSPQCRTTLRREGDNKGVGRKRTSGITNASDKAHHVQGTGVKGHGSFTIIVSRSSTFLSPPLSVSFSWMPSVPGLLLLCLLSSTGFRPCTRAGTTKGTARGRRREKETNDERELFSRQKPRHFLWNRGHGLSCPRWVSHSRMSPLFALFSQVLSRTPFEPVPRRVLPLHLRSPYPRLSTCSPCVACSRLPPPPIPLLSLSLFLSPVPRRRYVEYANKSCTNVPEVWTRSPINYSVGAADPPSLFRALPLSPFHLVRLPRALIYHRTASRRGSGVKFILQIYSFIYCERLFTPVPPDRITAAEREMYRTTADRLVVTVIRLTPLSLISNCWGGYYNSFFFFRLYTASNIE